MRNSICKAITLAFVLLLASGQEIFGQQGGLDTLFGTNSSGIYQDPLPSTSDATNIARRYGFVEVLADGKIIVGGSGTRDTTGGANYINNIVLRRLNANGSADVTFAGGAGTVQTTFLTVNGTDTNMVQPIMAVQPSDGKIVVAAQCSINASPNPAVDWALGTDLCLMRFNANGTLDADFGGNTVQAYGGTPSFPPTSYTMPGGKVWTYTGTDAVIPTRNGSFNGIPHRIRITPDGRIIVFGNSRDTLNASLAGSRSKGFIAIYAANGSLIEIRSLFDTTGNGADGWGETRIYDGDTLSNGDLVVVGEQRVLLSSNPAVFSQFRWKVMRGDNSGAFLNTGNASRETAYAITQVRSNKILIGGSVGDRPTLVRYNGDLTVDTTFGVGGRRVYDGIANLAIDTFFIGGMKTQTDGKIIGGTNNGNIFRINPDGSPDKSFARIREDVADSLSLRGVLANLRFTTPFPTRPGTDQRISYGNFAVRPNGKLVIAGSAGNGVGSPHGQAVVTQHRTSFRYSGTSTDFNNDGKSELSVFRPGDGVWHNLDSFSQAHAPFQWGVTGDKIAPADYDGDGRTDHAIFRDGIWYIYRSSDNQVQYAQWGVTGDLPRPGDFNGDGQADVAVFRPSNGTWYILYSNPIQPGNIAFTSVQFGLNGDLPLIADFDGDGRSDISVFRAGVWYYIRSSNQSFGGIQFGLAGDTPVAGDYDGDGSADIAVFRSGVWYVLQSTNGAVTVFNWGQAGDKAVPGDYDNDGKNDYAIYRGGVWWVYRSSDGSFSATGFGLATDMPMQAAYLQ